MTRQEIESSVKPMIVQILAVDDDEVTLEASFSGDL